MDTGDICGEKCHADHRPFQGASCEEVIAAFTTTIFRFFLFHHETCVEADTDDPYEIDDDDDDIEGVDFGGGG